MKFSLAARSGFLFTLCFSPLSFGCAEPDGADLGTAGTAAGIDATGGFSGTGAGSGAGFSGTAGDISSAGTQAAAGTGGEAGTGSAAGTGGTAGTGASGTGASGTGSAGTGTSGTGASGTGASGTGASGSGAAGTTSTPDRTPSADNPKECPTVAPDNPIGPCDGLPVYLNCKYGTYVCVCDWYHWLCAG